MNCGFTTGISARRVILHYLAKEETPCKPCRDGLHRICEQPNPIPTILAFVRGPKNQSSETLACCDRKDFWIQAVYQ